jgi:Dockerin type I domain
MDSRARSSLFKATAPIALVLLLGAAPLAADSSLSSVNYSPQTIPANAAELTRHLIEAGIDSAIVATLVETDPREALQLYSSALARFGRYIRGDVNSDGQVDVSDAVRLAHALFLGDQTVDCEEAGDVNGDRSLDVSDVVGIFNFLFKGDRAPVPPYPACGTDWGAFGMTCSAHGICPSAADNIQVCLQSALSGANSCNSLGQPYKTACELFWAVQAVRCMRSIARSQ